MRMRVVWPGLSAAMLAFVAGGLGACADAATRAGSVGVTSSAAARTPGFQKDLQMTSSELPPRASRRAPRRVEPIVLAGVRYEQVIGKLLPEQDESGRYLAAYDVATDKLLWGVKVFDTPQIADLERDVQAVFFASMQLDADAHALLIANERGRHFAVNLATHAVSEMPPTPQK